MNKTSQTNEKPAFVLWFTGLSGAGKSTLADRVYERLTQSGRRIERLDGDSLRAAFPATGFSRKDRDEHIKRVGYMASRLEHHGVIVVASFISPYREARDFVRGLCKNFIEVYVRASLEECRRRDVKGLYKKADGGQISQFTGLDDPYEEPTNPELVIDTEGQTVEESVEHIMDTIKPYL
jgi:adenylyl-sulfate kinase